MRAQWLLAAVCGVVIGLAGCASRNETKYVSQGTGVPLDNSNLYGNGDGSAGGRASSVRHASQVTAWPRVIVVGDTTNTVHQPQVESWDGHTLVARHAVAVQGPGQKQPLYGVVTVTSTTLVDKDQRTVQVQDPKITGSDFPSAPERGQEIASSLQRQWPRDAQTESLDQLESSLAVGKQQISVKPQPVENTPPKIIVATKPALLVAVDGPPTLKPVPDTQLQRVLNTRALLLKDAGGKYYLHLFDGYVQATDLNGPWSVGGPPIGAPIAEKQAREAGQVDLMQGEPDPRTGTHPSLGMGSPPEIYVSTEPTELLVFKGAPEFVPIPGTKLLYVTNTTANVFKQLEEQKNYVLLSGRWFRSASMDGPWEFVPGTELPADFAKIPDNSPKENVKASVPGTPQAKEALIANSIPQNTSVPKGSRMQEPQIDGEPQLAAIEGTPLQYVVNSGTPIIRVDDHSWYACQSGVWYAATSVNGPWVVAASVPEVIYTIPTSSPLHYVTYVRVYDTDANYVYSGYTPGYLGTVVAPGDVVVYGTGYYYRPWVGSVWYGYPVTWGYGCDPFWSPWAGWSFGFGFGYAAWYPYYWAWYPAPYWGPYRHWGGHGIHRVPPGWIHTSRNLYRPVAPVQTARRDNNTYGRAYNSRTGNLVAGENARVRNVFRNPGATAAGFEGVGRDGFTRPERPGEAAAGNSDWRRSRGLPSPAASSVSREGGMRGLRDSSPAERRVEPFGGARDAGRFSRPERGGGQTAAPAPSGGSGRRR